MLKKLDDGGQESAINKSSMKEIRRSLIEGSLFAEEQFEVVVPKKSAMTSIKTKSGDDQKVEIIVVEKEVVCAVIADVVVPTLRLVHKFPGMYPVFRCDKGALKFLLSGANVMAPGLTQPTSSMEDVEQGTMVSLYIEGKQHAIALGRTLMSTKEIRQVNKGAAVELIHFLNDGLWRFEPKKK